MKLLLKISLIVFLFVFLVNIQFVSAAQIKVLLLNADSNSSANSYVKNPLLALGHFSQIDVFNTRFDGAVPSLATLQQYDAVLTWSNHTYLDRVTTGDNLADYVDGGGGVVVSTFATGTGSLQLGGRFLSGSYYAISNAVQTNSGVSLGTVYDPNHMLLFGVDPFSVTWHATSTGVSTGATRIADWSDGTVAVAEKTVSGTPRVDVALFPTATSLYDPNQILLLSNALRYTAGELRNTAIGSDVSVDLLNGYSIEFGQVTVEGETLKKSVTDQAVFDSFLADNLVQAIIEGSTVDIITSSTLDGPSGMTVTLQYNQTDFNNDIGSFGFTEDLLRVFHKTSGGIIEQGTLLSLDTVTNTITAHFDTAGLSEFTVGVNPEPATLLLLLSALFGYLPFRRKI